MKSEQLMTLALQVVAIIIAAYACVDISNVVGFLLVGHQWMSSRAVEVSVLGRQAAMLWSIPIIVAVLLWWLAPRLARLACRRTERVLDFPELDIERLTHAAFVVVGFWVAVFGLIGLVRIGVNQLQWAGGPFSWSEFAAYMLRCVFGLAVVTGGRNLSRFLLRLRTAGAE